MPRYCLKYSGSDHSVQSIYFEARTLGGALDIARKSALGDWAELSEDERPVCSLELVSDDGVWLVGGPDCRSAIQRIEIPNPQPS